MLAPRPIRVLVIGAGITSNLIHLPILARLQKEGAIELAVICDLDDARAAAAQARHGFKDRCGDAAGGVRRPDIDAVYVLGSAQMHFNFGLQALRQGKHLFVEKPIAPSWAEARTLAQAAQAAGKIAAGGHNRRFYKSLVQARERGGKAGWRYAEAMFYKPESGRPPPFGARTWLSANGIHALDALVFVMGGLPEEMTAVRSGETFSAILRWADGRQGVFLSDNSAGNRLERYRFHAPGVTLNLGQDEIPPEGDGFEAEHRAFLAAIATGADPPHSIAALAPSLFLAERIEEGYSREIDLPAARLAPALPTARSCLLVDRPLGLIGELARFDTVSIGDVDRSEGARPEIVGAVLGRGAEPLSPRLLDKLPNLRVVGVVALSLARHAPEALLERGITLVNASDAYADSVADFALALAILGRRRAFQSHDAMRSGDWGAGKSDGGLTRYARALGVPVARAVGLEAPLRRLWTNAARGSGHEAPTAPRELKGATVGLIGWGANARAFSRRLQAAGAWVLVFSEHAADEEIEGAERASLSDVLGADIVSLHRGLTPRTRHFLGDAELARLRPGCVLINVARGALIEPEALLRRLKRGDIFACLDTFETEPLPVHDRLNRLPNVFLTSHIAGGSADMHAAAAREVVAKVGRVLAGERVASVSAARLETMT